MQPIVVASYILYFTYYPILRILLLKYVFISANNMCMHIIYSYYILCIYIHIDIAICFIHNAILLNLSITYSYKII